MKNPIFENLMTLLLPDEISKLQNAVVEQKGDAGVAAMLAIGVAAQQSSLAAFTAAVQEYSSILIQDPVIATHLTHIREDMLEKNITRYSTCYGIPTYRQLTSLGVGR